MKQQFAVFFAALLVAATLACNKHEESYTDTASTSTTASDTSATASTYDTTGSSATSTTSTAAAANLDPADKDFMTKAAQGGMAEVQLGTTAQSKATDPAVKAFADRMVTDHSKANDELKQLATTKGMSLPTDIGDAEKKVADELSKKTGKDFDKAYMKAMVEDHEKDVKEFEKQSKDAKDADLKAWAGKTLPTLQDHLKMAKDAASKVK